MPETLEERQQQCKERQRLRELPCGWDRYAMDGCFTLKTFFLAAGVLIITLVVCEGIGQ